MLPVAGLSGATGASRHHLLAVFDEKIGILPSTPLTVEHEVVLTRPAVLLAMDVSAEDVLALLDKLAAAGPTPCRRIRIYR